jgi:polyhydroxyalkanoate synthesis regulator phasin
MYDTDLVRKLCREIGTEKNPDRMKELLSLLHSIIKDDHEEARSRIAFLTKRYADILNDTKAAD